jgi:hypothetical protein
VLLAVLLAAPAQSQDVAELFLFKAAWYQQDSPADPALLPQAQDPYDLTALARLSDGILSDPEWYLWITGMMLRTPTGNSVALSPDLSSGWFDFYDGAVSASALNLRYRATTYRFTLSSILTGDSHFETPLASQVPTTSPTAFTLPNSTLGARLFFRALQE